MAASFSFSFSLLDKAINLCIIIFMLFPLSFASKGPIDVSSTCPHILTTASLKNYVPPNNQTLLVVVPWKVGFEQFVKFSPDSCLFDGFSVQVFLQALRRMPPPALQFEFVLHGDGSETPSFEDMVDMVARGEVGAVVADLTITKDRMDKVGFTVPYLASKLAIVTTFRYGSAGTYWDFLKPFSMPLWLTLLGSFVVTGIALYLLEDKNPDFLITTPKRKKHQTSSDASSADSSNHSTLSADVPPLDTLMPSHTSAPTPSSPPRDNTRNPLVDPQAAIAFAQQSSAPPPPPPIDYIHTLPFDPSSLQCQGPPIYDQASRQRRILNSYWFTSLCVFAAQQESVRTHLGRFVTVMWLFVMLIFNSSYTASLASMLSAQKKYPTIQGFQTLLQNENISVGYQEGSFMKSYMKRAHIESKRLKNFNSEREYAQALREGNMKPDGVGAVLDETPYINILLQSECDFTKSSDDANLPSFGGFAFAFAKNSTLIEDVSKMILAMAEDETIHILQNGWKITKGENSDTCNSSDPSHLRLRSFGGLFSILVSVYVICIVWRLSANAIQSKDQICSPLTLACACAQCGVSIFQGPLSRRSRKVSDENLELDTL